MEKNIRTQLPQKIFLPDQNGDKAEVKVDPGAYDHLEEEDSTHDDHHFLDDRCKTISKRETVVAHLSFLVSRESQVVRNKFINRKIRKLFYKISPNPSLLKRGRERELFSKEGYFPPFGKGR